MRLLLVDDDPDIRTSVRVGFELQWRDVEILEADIEQDEVRAPSACAWWRSGGRTSSCSMSACRTSTDSRCSVSFGPSPRSP